MKKNRLFLVFGLLLLVSVLSACLDGDSGNTEDSKESSNKEDGENVVNIGFSGPLSGPAANFGENSLNGLKLAVEEINEDGFEVNGEKHSLNLVSLDDKYLPNETASNAKRLVQENDTSIIFTPHSGGIYALQVFNEQEEFIIGGYSSEPRISEEENSLTVQLPPTYDIYLDPFVDYTMNRFGEKIAVIPPVTEYGQDWAGALAPYWEEQGGEVVHEASVDFGKDTDFFTLLTNALEEDPDVLFIGGPSEPTANLLNQARDLGFEGGFIVMEQAKLDEMEKVTGSYDKLEGAIGVMPFVNVDNPGREEYIEKYNEVYGEEPGSESGLHYMSMYIFTEAMKAAGNVEDAEVIYNNIQAGLDVFPENKQVYDIPSINDNGSLGVETHIGAVEDGEIINIEME